MLGFACYIPRIAMTAVVQGTPIVTGSVVAQDAKPSLHRTNTARLVEHGWPAGLIDAMAESVAVFPERYVIVDNSGSMQSTDGSRLIHTQDGGRRSIRATRWAELGDLVVEMAEVATKINSPTHFHLLNESELGQLFTVSDCGASVDKLKAVMKTTPRSTTPLTEAVQQVTQKIRPSRATLTAKGQKVVVVLCTDGLPNDPTSFLRALQELQRLPVWLVVRLCTSEDSIVEYWSELDKQLEAPLETLDDVEGESREIYPKNAWLTYAPALHLARTMGLHDRLFDLIDEVPLLPSQAKQLCERILGCDELPEPELDEHAFKAALGSALSQMPNVYNPIKKKMTPWVDVDRIMGRRRCVDSGFCAIS